MRARDAWGRGLCCIALVLAVPAWGNTFELHGFGPRAIGLSGAVSADARDYAASFYNPAMLVRQDTVDFGFGFSWNRMMASVERLDRTKELDCTYCEPPDAVGYDLGLVFPLGGKVKNRVSLGVGLHVPSQRFLRFLAVDPNRPYWYFHQAYPERFVLFAGAGVRLTQWLSVGLGVQALDDLLGNGISVRMDLFSKQVKMREFDTHMSNRAGPTFALLLTPHPAVRVAATFRWEMAILIAVPARIDLEDVGTLDLEIRGTSHYWPHTGTVAASWDILPELTLSAEASYLNWSAAPSPYLLMNVDLSGDLLAALGLDDALDLETTSAKPGFADSFIARLGIEHRLTDRFAARMGLSYRPTPVPLQSAPGTNLLDGSWLGASAGMGFAFDDPLMVFERPVHIDLGVQGALLLSREANKDPTDVVPRYRYSARMVGGTAALRYDF